MKSKKSKIFFKLSALFMCVALILPVLFACGEKPDGDTAATGDTIESITEAATTPEPTPEPTTPEPTEPPTTAEPFIPDLSLPYWEQIQAELAYFGLVDGVKILPGEDEAALMKGFSTGNAKKEELDVSGDGVPFSAAYRVTVAKDTANFWDASYTRAMEKDIPVEQDDLIVGVMWVRGARLSETEMFMGDDFPEYYLAIKTATDDWATEGGVEPSREQFAEPEWQKVFFYGYVTNEESNSRNVQFQIFIGYGNQQLDFGGITAYWFPGTLQNELAAMKLVDSNY